MYATEDQGVRYETNRFDRMSSLGGGYGGYDMSGAQTWNANGFGGNGTFGGLGGGTATGRMKPTNRSRMGIPNVSVSTASEMDLG